MSRSSLEQEMERLNIVTDSPSQIHNGDSESHTDRDAASSPEAKPFDFTDYLNNDDALEPVQNTLSNNSANISAPSPQALHDGVESPNGMQLDHDEVIVEPENEKDDTAIIDPDSELENVPRANDCMSVEFVREGA